MMDASCLKRRALHDFNDCLVSDTQGEEIGISGHHTTGVSPEDDLYAEDHQ